MGRASPGSSKSGEALTPIASYRHNESTDGDPWFLVETPNRAFDKERLGVQFVSGIGRTRSIKKAQRFSEEFGYEVILPPGVTPWLEIVENPLVNRGEDLGGENTVPVVLESEY